MSSTQNPKAPSVSESGARSAAPSRSLFPLPDALVGRMQEIGRVLGDELAVAETREQKAILQYEVAEIDERVRGDEPSAARGYLTAFNARPAFRAPLDALIRLYTRRKSTANLSKLYETLVKAAPTPRDRADAMVMRAELQEDALGDPDGARASFEAAAATEPNHRVAWVGLERVALRSGDSALLLRALERLAEFTRDPGRKARLLQELAAEQSRVGTPGAIEEAARRLHEAAALPLGRWRSLQELERFGEQHERPQDVVFALEARAELAQAVAQGESFQGGSGAFTVSRLVSAEQASMEAADLWARAARLRFVALGDAAGARMAMERALALRPSDPRAQYAAMTLSDQVGDIESASGHAAWLLEHEFGDPSTRASLHFRLAESAALRGDLAAASVSLRAALALDAGSAAARGALLEQLLASGDSFEAVREFDDLAAESAPGPARASLHRAAAVLTLALRADVDGALQRFRKASEEDPGDLVSRRAVVLMLARAAATAALPDEALALQRARVSAIDALLPHAVDADERASLLLERFYAERFELRDNRAAALTAEKLVEATAGARWAAESAALLWASAGVPAAASRWAETVAQREDHGDPQDARAWRAAAARLAWAGGDESRARALAVSGHADAPDDDYLAALALSLAAASRDGALVLEVATRRAEAATDHEATRWLVFASVILGRMGDEDRVRAAMELAMLRDPASPVVRAAARFATRWRGDAPTRARLQEAAAADGPGADEEVAGALELALVRAFVDHDLGAAQAVVERVSTTEVGGAATAVLMLLSLLRGATVGPDAEATTDALQALLSAIPSNDPLRVGVELEVARALSATASTRDQAATARDLVREERPQLTAPRVLAMLDAVQREGRVEVPEALRRLAERSDDASGPALTAAAVAALRAQGRLADARSLALNDVASAPSVVALSEIPPTLDRAAEHADALARRAEMASPGVRAQWLRRAAHWASLAGEHEAAIAHAEALLALAPDDLVALDVLRVSGRRARQWPVVVSACERLAATVRAADRAAAAWEEAGIVAAESLGDERRAERCLRSALERHPSRVVAYQRLREILEGRRDTAAMEALVSARVSVVDDPKERAALFWEQARLRRALGLREGALDAARRVVALDPEHVAARALVAEVHASSGRLAETADALVALAACAEAPRAQRRVARSGALELFEHRLGRPDRAIEQIEALLREGEGDDALVERGFAVAAAAERWEDALRFAQRVVERTPPGVAQAAALLRVAHLYRDRLRDPVAARDYAQRAHEAFPADLRILETLTALSDPDDRGRHARRTLDTLRETLRLSVPKLSVVLNVAEAARLGGDGVLQRAAERLAAAMGAEFRAPRVGDPAGRASLRDPALVLRYRNPNDSGRAVALLETLMPELAELAGLSTDALKVGRSDRIKGPHATRAAVSQWLALLGVNEFELYVGGPDPARIAIIPGDPVAVVIGRAVAVPFDAATRFEVLRQALLVTRGVGALAAAPIATCVGWTLAAMIAADIPLAGGARGAEPLVKPVAKAMSRRVRRAIAESAKPLGAAPGAWDEIAAAVAAVRSTARRGAVSLTGAIPSAFRDVAVAEGAAVEPVPQMIERNPAGRDLSLFLVSDACAQVLRETGVDVG